MRLGEKVKTQEGERGIYIGRGQVAIEKKGSIELKPSKNFKKETKQNPLKKTKTNNGKKLAPGDHIKSKRLAYSHHGIYLGNKIVAHYSGLCENLSGGPVEVCSIEKFKSGSDLILEKRKGNIRSPQRALSRLGEKKYNLIKNNCEHFASWASQGKNKSTQVENAKKAINTLILLIPASKPAHIVTKAAAAFITKRTKTSEKIPTQRRPIRNKQVKKRNPKKP